MPLMFSSCQYRADGKRRHNSIQDNEVFTFALQNFRFPFDWKNPNGYMIACSIEYIFLLNILFATFYGLVFQMGSIFMLIWMTEDIKRDLNAINDEVTVKENRRKFANRFVDTIQFYYDGKQLSDKRKRGNGRKESVDTKI